MLGWISQHLIVAGAIVLLGVVGAVVGTVAFLIDIDMGTD